MAASIEYSTSSWSQSVASHDGAPARLAGELGRPGALHVGRHGRCWNSLWIWGRTSVPSSSMLLR